MNDIYRWWCERRVIGHSGLLRVFSLKNILAAMAGIGVSHRLTPYKIVGRSYLKKIQIWCSSGNIREVLIFTNFSRRRHSRIPGFRENYYYNSTTKVKSPKIRNSRKFEHAEITRSTGVSYSWIAGTILLWSLLVGGCSLCWLKSQ